MLQLGDPLFDGIVLARVQHNAQGMFGKHASHVTGTEKHPDSTSKRGQQSIGLAESNAGNEVCPVVRLDQQQGLPLFTVGGISYRVVHALEHA